MRCRKTLATLVLLLSVHAARAADPYKAAPGPYPVANLLADWKDPARPGGEITVPVKLYFPKTLASLKDPLPLILFSHGLGGSREGYASWAEHWASHGYIVLLPTHAGSDTVAVLNALRAADAATTAVARVVNAQTAVRRAQDISFVITHMDAANAGTLTESALAPFKGKVDLKHVGMAGHSFGAQTTLMVCGANESLLGARSYAEPRITAAIAMSPQPTLAGDQKVAFASIKVPLFHMTGTLDDSPINLGDIKAADRRIPFDNSPLPDTSLVIFKGATHMTFSSRAAGPSPAELNCFSLIRQSTTAFWDAHLKSDPKAAAWFQDDFPKVLGVAGTFERKKPQ